MRKKYVILMGLVILGIIFGRMEDGRKEVFLRQDAPKAVIDAGHGGRDPGKTAEDILEKDINLEIALRLGDYMELGGWEVVYTRVEDKDLGAKSEDMRERAALGEDAEIFISIHQNSYPSAKVHGAQTFYRPDSEAGKALAESIQAALCLIPDENGAEKSGSGRKAAPSSGYYILNKTRPPAVIVECGFLSNPGERKKLSTEEYRNKIAWAIWEGVSDWYEKMKG